MPSPIQLIRRVLNSVSPNYSITHRLALCRPAIRRSLHARVNPIIAVAGGAAGVTGLATYLTQTTSLKKAPYEDTAILVPQIKQKGDGKRKVEVPVRALDVSAATELLRKEQKSKLFDLGNGRVGRCDVVRFASNSPVEDEHSCATGKGPGGNLWTYWGVYDGHAGWATSAVLREDLIPFVSDALERLPADASSADISEHMTKAFLALDDEINDGAHTSMSSDTAEPGSADVIAKIAAALSGSCALLAAYDPIKTTLRVACVGDSRAVLGRASTDGKSYTAIPLSKDQTGKNPDEYARLVAAHPGEEDTMIDRASGRLLGLAVTRAFGDHRWKWPVDTINEAQQKYWGSAPRPATRTPPYLTAEPVIEETTVRKGGASYDFLIMASDGFWDHVSNEDAVELVARWIDAKRANTIAGPPTDVLKYKPAKAKPSEQWWLDEGGFGMWWARPEHFVVEDDNAATHLVKNAFGGARRGLFCGVMSSYPPISRKIRDDITVQVIFFGDV